ncbi:sporulation protein YqfD [Thermohalobacter berrensis]|uniref:Sporulation protein YqfD n=1 Tax=Thermohalobacter berrensis TaxID=99594 RepID=A0A419TBA2_9FIRM|nr:sporulation protein YqfD [Thermohalobacter berrensis]RKD34732.1 sporulation protein YqfD [Thermohalobacter berrensis]
MLVIRIWNYFRGYVIIKIEGLTLEKFINLAIAKGIYLWDIVRYDYTTLEAKVGIKGFKELRDVVKKVGCRVSIVEKKGYPFLVHKLRYRKMLAFGFVIALAIVIFLTSFIWSIDVINNEKIEDEYIIDYLQSLGIKPGILKYNIDTQELKRMLLTDLDVISYAHVEIKGTKLIVDIKEREKIIKKIKENVPCHIVAKKKAVIQKVIAKNGKSVVEKGDIVKKGQILISGIIEDPKLENPLLVHSEGTIYGKTWYKLEIREPIYKIIKNETGRIYKSREIKIGNKKIQMMEGDIPFNNYIKKTKEKNILKWGDMKLPTKILIHEYREVEVERVKQNVDSLKQQTTVKGVQQIMDKLPKNARVVSKDVEFSIEDNTLITKINIGVIEEIGIKQKINYSRED